MERLFSVRINNSRYDVPWFMVQELKQVFGQDEMQVLATNPIFHNGRVQDVPFEEVDDFLSRNSGARLHTGKLQHDERGFFDMSGVGNVSHEVHEGSQGLNPPLPPPTPNPSQEGNKGGVDRVGEWEQLGFDLAHNMGFARHTIGSIGIGGINATGSLVGIGNMVRDGFTDDREMGYAEFTDALTRGYNRYIQENSSWFGSMLSTTMQSIPMMVISRGVGGGLARSATATGKMANVGLSGGKAQLAGMAVGFGAPVAGGKYTETSQREDVHYGLKVANAIAHGATITILNNFISFPAFKKVSRALGDQYSKGHLMSGILKDVGLPALHSARDNAVEEFVELWANTFWDRMLLGDEIDFKETLNQSIMAAMQGAFSGTFMSIGYGTINSANKIGKVQVMLPSGNNTPTGSGNAEISPTGSGLFVKKELYAKDKQMWDDVALAFVRGEQVDLVARGIKPTDFTIDGDNLDAMRRNDENRARNSEVVLENVESVLTKLYHGAFAKNPNQALEMIDAYIKANKDYVDSETLDTLKEIRDDLSPKDTVASPPINYKLKTITINYNF